MTTDHAEILLYKFFDPKQNICIPRITNLGIGHRIHFETDFLSISKSGYATAVEIKVSKTDLLRDKEKEHIKKRTFVSARSHKRELFDVVDYYEAISAFYYAVPSNIIIDALNQIPDFAGLLELTDSNVRVVRNAKGLNRYKWRPEEQLSVLRLISIRAAIMHTKLHDCKTSI